MKSNLSFSATVATVALMAVAGFANAQTPTKAPPAAPTSKQAQVCIVKQQFNADLLAKAQAAKTPAERLAILKAAMEADPENAPCIADLALQMAMAGGISPAAGPEETADFGIDGAAPGENPNQLNGTTGGTGTPSVSPAAPETFTPVEEQ